MRDFDFELPHELIAYEPLARGQAKLLYYDGEEIKESVFNSLERFLAPGDLIILNNSKVLPALLTSQDGIKINLIKKIDEETWQILGKPRKKITVNSKLVFSDRLEGRVMQKGELDSIKFNLKGDDFYQALDESGQMPLPPYIKREASEKDRINYQTVFAKEPGSVAAPTAGLHFSQDLLNSLEKKGIKISYLTLTVGGGTFLPIRSDNLEEHIMHYEDYSLSEELCNLINKAKEEGRRIIAVGTTTARALESAALLCGSKLYPHKTETNLFIKPGFQFKIVDALITNFHLPKSTLFILIASFIGSLEKAKEVYHYAIAKQYRFFSYGDSSFLTRKKYE